MLLRRILTKLQGWSDDDGQISRKYIAKKWSACGRAIDNDG